MCPYCSIKGRAASGPSGDISGFPFGFPFAMDVDSPLNLCLGVHPPSKATAVTTTPTTNLIEHLAMSSRGSNCRSFKNASSLRHYFSSRIAVSSPFVRVHRPLPSRQTTLNAWFYQVTCQKHTICSNKSAEKTEAGEHFNAVSDSKCIVLAGRQLNALRDPSEGKTKTNKQTKKQHSRF